MSAYADTGFVVSLFLQEMTSEAADRAFSAANVPICLSQLSLLEVRNAFNLGIIRGRLTAADRDSTWTAFEAQVNAGDFVVSEVEPSLLFQKARELSDRHTPLHATRSLDLLHVSAAILLGANEFLSFDERQRRVASAEGLAVKP